MLVPEAIPVYCETGAEHEDNERYLTDCERWFGRPVKRLRNEKYADTWDVWQRHRYLAGVNGAKCTVVLKVMPRLEFQLPTDIHIFGYTCDPLDQDRAERLADTYPELSLRFPLIERGINKAACLAMIERAGIKLPPLYAMGFQNNNCIPCVKATSPNYWALVRQRFPEKFDRIAKLARDLDVRLCRIDDERRFIDEIPGDWPTTNPLQPSCDFLCHLAEQDIEHLVSANARNP